MQSLIDHIISRLIKLEDKLDRLILGAEGEKISQWPATFFAGLFVCIITGLINLINFFLSSVDSSENDSPALVLKNTSLLF